jgi:diguanylate cyclase (GGDEF)-like protein
MAMTAQRTVAAAVRGHSAVAVAGLLTVFSLIWCVLNLYGPWAPALGWVPPVLGFGLMTWEKFRLGIDPALAPAARRFWRSFGVAAALLTAGTVIQAHAAITAGRVDPEDLPRPTIALFLAAALTMLWALLRLPAGARSAADWTRMGLDGATVMVASALFAWRFALEPLLERELDTLVLAGLLGAAVACQLAVAAVVKVLLAGSGPVDPGSLRILCAGIFVGSFMASVSALLASQSSQVAPSQLVICPLALMALLAAARQRRVAAAEKPAAENAHRERRPFSLLPYAAVAATQILLVSTAVSGDMPMTVVIGAVLVTILVVIRQWGAFHDISRLLATVRRQEERLRHQASHDALTQLANRALFGERLDAALSDRLRGTPAVLLIDLDDFKAVNDTLGHAAGDSLLIAVAQRLSGCVRPVDIVARLGGDEFVVLLAGADLELATRVSERVLASLADPVHADGHTMLVRASVGVAMATPEDDAERLLRNADTAMYQAKQGGKASLAWYGDTTPARAEAIPAAQQA